MPKFILLNGPPRSGKDTAALAIIDALAELGTIVYHDKLSAPLKMAFAGMMEAEMNEDFCVEPYEATKEAIIPSLGVSYRQWQIDFSETFMKPKYGNDVFGRLLWQRLEESEIEDNSVVVISDCGFQVEVDYLIEHAGKENILILRLVRDGTSFDGDSRSYVSFNGAACHDVRNNWAQTDFEQRVVTLVRGFVGV